MQTADQAPVARKRELIVIVPLLAITLVRVPARASSCSASTRPCASAAAIVMVVLGWALARDLGRFTGAGAVPAHGPGDGGHRRVPDPARVHRPPRRCSRCGSAGLQPETLAVGGAITAVVFGLAAQQTLGNLIAGMVLISARPFKVGDRVRLQAGGLAGQIEGVVASLGLLYTTFAQGRRLDHGPEQRRARPPRSCRCASPRRRRPARAAAARRHGRATSRRCSRRASRTPVRSEPHISLEEVDRDEVDRPDRGHAGAASPTARSWPTRCWPPSARSRGPTRTTTTSPPIDRVPDEPPPAAGTRRLALVALAASRICARRARSRRAGAARSPTASGREPPTSAAPSRSAIGATSTSDAVALDRRHHGVGDVLGRLGADVAGQLRAGRRGTCRRRG